MKYYLKSQNSDTLLIFFAGWGCDEFEFQHLKSNSDVLILYDYSDLNLEFDFSNYKKYNLIAFSAGVFVASVFKFDFKPNKKIAMSGNPFLFDEYYGLSKEIQDILYNVTEETADEFAKNYLIKTKEEYKKFNPSKRTIESCQLEFNNLKNLYNEYKNNIKDIYDTAYVGNDDMIFNVSAQKEFYKNRLHIIENARHNLFFRINKFEDIFEQSL